MQQAHTTFLTSLPHYPDERIRLAKVVEHLHSCEDSAVVGFFSLLLERAPAHALEADLLITLVLHRDVLHTTLGQGRFWAFSTLAHREGEPLTRLYVRSFVLSTHYAEGRASCERRRYDPHEVPLGVRTETARTTGCQDTLERLLLDPSARVVQNVLRNVHLREEQVLRILGAPGCNQETVLAVLADRRWRRRRRVRISLAGNPHVPLVLAAVLLLTCNRAERRDVLQRASLPMTLVDLITELDRQSLEPEDRCS